MLVGLECRSDLRDTVGSEPGLKLWEILQAAAQFRWLRSTGTVFDRGV